MKLISFQVTKFRNIVDSGIINIDESVTCLVGKNEAGKSGILEALYLFNPAYKEKFNVEAQYPRWLSVQDRRIAPLEETVAISVTLDLEEFDKESVESILGKGVITGDAITIKKKYNGNTTWSISWDEAAAIQNMIADMPEPIRPLVKEAKTLIKLKEFLGGIDVNDEDIEVTADNIQEANTVFVKYGVDTTEVWNKIVEILKTKLPKFFRFTAYSTLPGRIDLKQIAENNDEGPGRSELQTARALLSLAGTDTKQLANDDYELRTGELEAVQIDLTRQVFEYWKQNPDLEVNIDVDKKTENQPNGQVAVARYLDIRLRDRRTGYSNNFSQRSSGFQWFFSFLAAFSEFRDEECPIILLDEPALTLHGRAQRDFLRFINERLAAHSSVIYTTHSPFMVEADRLERVRVVEDLGPPLGSVCTEDVVSTSADSLFPLQAALGYDIAQSLFVGSNNLVVEGTSDYIYLTVMSRACLASGRTGLDPRWRILPAGGATNIPTFVSLIGPHLDVTVLADSDTKGMQRVTNMVEKKLLDGHRLIMANIATESDHADIEDLFSEENYLDIYNKTFDSSVGSNDLPEGNRIVKRIEAHTKTPYDHGQVAETLLRTHQDAALSDDSLNRFSTLFSVINSTMKTQ